MLEKLTFVWIWPSLFYLLFSSSYSYHKAEIIEGVQYLLVIWSRKHSFYSLLTMKWLVFYCFKCRVTSRNKCVCAKFLQSCLTLCHPMDCSTWGSSVPGNSPGKNAGVGSHFLLQGIFPIQGPSPHLLCFLHWKAGSLTLAPPGKHIQKEGREISSGQTETHEFTLILAIFYGGAPKHAQATQNGCSLVFCMSLALPVPSSPTPYSQDSHSLSVTETNQWIPTYYPQVVILLTFRQEHFHYDSLSKSGQAPIPLLVSLVTIEPTYNPL